MVNEMKIWYLVPWDRGSGVMEWGESFFPNYPVPSRAEVVCENMSFLESATPSARQPFRFFVPCHGKPEGLSVC